MKEDSIVVMRVVIDVTVIFKPSARPCAGYTSICGEKLMAGVSASG